MENNQEIKNIDEKLQELFNAHTPQSNYLSQMCNHYYCNILSIAKLTKSSNNKIETFVHVHDAYEFLIPLEPTPMIMQNNAIYFGEVGYIYPIMSGRHHGVQIEYNDISNYNITINKSYIENRMNEKGLHGCEFNSRFMVSDKLNTLLKLFIDEFDKGKTRDNIDLNLLAMLIISEIIDAGCASSLPDRRKPVIQYQKGMKAIVDYMFQHFSEELNIQALSKMAGFTPNYFISSFKKMMGETPYEYINKIRISKAKILLENTDLTINDISIQCGFQKVSSFTSLFKTRVNLTPSQYRDGKRTNF